MKSFRNIIVTEIREPFTVHSDKDKYFQKEHREWFGLSLCISGQITYTTKDATYISRPGYAVILPQGGCYTLQGEKPGLFPLINFQCTGLTPGEFLVLPLDDPQGCIADYEAIRARYLQGGAQLEVFSLFYHLLDKVLQPRQVTDPRLSPVLDHIRSNLSDPNLSNALLAQKMGISEVYLRKLFLARLGATPKQYILEKRLQEAKQLLLNTDKSVTAIAEACGFSGVYHFCRIFKDKVGISPTQYASQNRVFRL